VLALRSSRIRRIAGSLLILCLGFLVAESLIADTCDGDAAGGRARSAWALDGAGARASASVDVSPEAPAEPGDSGPAGHTTHVDHCVHPHAGAPIVRGELERLPDPLPETPPAEAVLEPPSRSIAPLDRPPAP
jgi:hypothetical protein